MLLASTCSTLASVRASVSSRCARDARRPPAAGGPHPAPAAPPNALPRRATLRPRQPRSRLAPDRRRRPAPANRPPLRLRRASRRSSPATSASSRAVRARRSSCSRIVVSSWARRAASSATALVSSVRRCSDALSDSLCRGHARFDLGAALAAGGGLALQCLAFRGEASKRGLRIRDQRLAAPDILAELKQPADRVPRCAV